MFPKWRHVVDELVDKSHHAVTGDGRYADPGRLAQLATQAQDVLLEAPRERLTRVDVVLFNRGRINDELRSGDVVAGYVGRTTLKW
jgi:2',3'-cyclic-nucleotide 2'-phosphodiesterase (5'-nucleotidase family)